MFLRLLKFIELTLAIVVFCFCIVACENQKSYLVNADIDDPSIIVEDFSSSKLGKFPGSWESRDPLGKEIYSIKEENGEKYLHAFDPGDSVLIVKKISWDFEAHPYLKWDWRIHKLPDGANERHGLTNDSAAAVYVLFKNRWYIPVPKYIKYVWSSTLPQGEAFIYKVFRAVIVLESGEAKLNRWISETVNIAEDYRRLYGEDPSRIVGIGILTDANATHSTAEASYDNFRISVK